MSGFVAISRDIIDHPLFKGEPQRLYAWLWLISKAAWKPVPYDVNGKIITVERGQICTSRAQMADAWGVSPSWVERFLVRLKTEQMIGQDTGQGRSIITICNYEKYQTPKEKTGQPIGQRSDSDRTAKEPVNQITKERTPLPPTGEPVLELVETGHPAKTDDVAELFNAWNEIAAVRNLRACRAIDTARRRKAKARIAEHGMEELLECIGRAGLSSFLTGNNERGHRAGIEYILEPSKLIKLQEGLYDDRKREKPPPQSREPASVSLITDFSKRLRA